MKGKRRLKAFAGLVALSGAAWALVSWLLAPPVITDQRFGRVQPGMTLAEVVAVLGSKPRDVDPMQYGVIDPKPGDPRAVEWEANPRAASAFRLYDCVEDTAFVWVWLDADGVVHDKWRFAGPVYRESVFKRVHRSLFAPPGFGN